MREHWRAILMAVAFLAIAPGSALADRNDQAKETLRQAQDALDTGRPADAARLVQELVAGRSFASLSPHNKHAAILMLAVAAAREPGCDSALPLAQQTVQVPTAGEAAWNSLFAQTYACDDYPGAAGILTTLIQRYPRVVAGLGNSEVFRITPHLEDIASLRFLLDNGWTHDPTLDLSMLRLQLMRRLHAAGQIEQTVVVAREMASNARTDLGSLVEFLSDKTFDPIVATDPAAFAFDTMSARQLANSEADALASPERLELINALTENLLARGRIQEARAVIEDALARAREGTRRRPTFADQAGHMNWSLNLRARILAHYGMYDDALEAMQQGAEQPESGRRVNVSQTLNHIGLLIDTGQPQEAIAELDRFELRLASPYGRQVARQLRVCALAELGDENATRAALADVVTHRRESLLIVRSAAMCANDLDLAAQTFIEQLNDPAERRDALISLQRYLNADPTRPGQMHDIISRPEVAATVDRLAHVGTFAILRPY